MVFAAAAAVGSVVGLLFGLPRSRLVNLGKIGQFLDDLQKRLSDPLGGAAYSGTVGISLVIVGALAGGMLSYMWTTLRLRELLETIENEFDRDKKLDSPSATAAAAPV